MALNKLILLFALIALTAAWGINGGMDEDEMNEGMDEGMEEDMDRAESNEWDRADKNGSSPRPCSPAGKCFAHSDCGSKGRCLGIFGTCNCAQCLTGTFCNAGALLGQAQCGGLRDACNSTNNLCNCEAGFKSAGFQSLGDAILKFCNKEQCDGQTDTCNGLPCNAGFCACG